MDLASRNASARWCGDHADTIRSLLAQTAGADAPHRLPRQPLFQPSPRLPSHHPRQLRAHHRGPTVSCGGWYVVKTPALLEQQDRDLRLLYSPRLRSVGRNELNSAVFAASMGPRLGGRGKQTSCTCHVRAASASMGPRLGRRGNTYSRNTGKRNALRMCCGGGMASSLLRLSTCQDNRAAARDCESIRRSKPRLPSP